MVDGNGIFKRGEKLVRQATALPMRHDFYVKWWFRFHGFTSVVLLG